VHADGDSEPHGITSRDCGLLAGVDVFRSALHILCAELAETMPKFVTKFSSLVSSAGVEVATNTESTTGVATTDGIVGSLSNSEETSVEIAERKCSEQQLLVSVMAAKFERNVETGSVIILANWTDADLSNSEAKATPDDEHNSDFDFESVTEVLLVIST